MKAMIRNKSVIFSALASVVMMTACSSEEDMTSAGSNELTGRVMYATGAYNDGDAPKTRMSYDDDFKTNHLTLAWSEGDAFFAFINGSTKKYDFAIQAPANDAAYTASETFKCDNFANDVTDGTIIDAIYPAVSDESVNPGNITLSLATQAQKGNSTTDHLKYYDYMVGHATYKTVTPNELNFNFKDKGDGNSGRLASIYRIKVALPSTVTSVSKIEISCSDANSNTSLVTSEKVNFTNGSTSALADDKGIVTLSVTNGAPTNGEFVAYVMLFPSAVKTRTITVTTTDNGAEKVYTDTKTYDSEVIYTRGQFKYIDLDFIPKNFKSKYTIADYFYWDAYSYVTNGMTAFSEGNYGFHTGTGVTAEHSCASCPTAQEMVSYLNAGSYWDDGCDGEGKQTCIVPTGDGSTSTTVSKGLWLKKKKLIDNFGKETFDGNYNGSTNMTNLSTLEAYEIKEIRTSGEYFFLPAAGVYNGGFNGAGGGGCYWSSTPSDDGGACSLGFGGGGVGVGSGNRDYGYLPMVAE